MRAVSWHCTGCAFLDKSKGIESIENRVTVLIFRGRVFFTLSLLKKWLIQNSWIELKLVLPRCLAVWSHSLAVGIVCCILIYHCTPQTPAKAILCSCTLSGLAANSKATWQARSISEWLCSSVSSKKRTTTGSHDHETSATSHRYTALQSVNQCVQLKPVPITWRLPIEWRN